MYIRFEIDKCSTLNIVKNLSDNVSFYSKSSVFLSRGKQQLQVENPSAFIYASVS